MMLRCTQVMNPRSIFEVEVEEHVKEQEEGNHTEYTYDVVTDSEEGDNAPHWARRRSVHFAVTVKKHQIESHESYTEEEKRNCWYTREEKEENQSDLRTEVAHLNDGEPETRNRSLRGLETMSDKGSEEFGFQVFMLINHVLDEQDRQWNADIFDDVMFASISQSLTAANVGKALLLAQQDEKEATKIHRANKRQQRRSKRRNKKASHCRRNDPPGASGRLEQRTK